MYDIARQAVQYNTQRGWHVHERYDFLIVPDDVWPERVEVFACSDYYEQVRIMKLKEAPYKNATSDCFWLCLTRERGSVYIFWLLRTSQKCEIEGRSIRKYEFSDFWLRPTRLIYY